MHVIISDTVRHERTHMSLYADVVRIVTTSSGLLLAGLPGLEPSVQKPEAVRCQRPATEEVQIAAASSSAMSCHMESRGARAGQSSSQRSRQSQTGSAQIIEA